MKDLRQQFEPVQYDEVNSDVVGVIGVCPQELLTRVQFQELKEWRETLAAREALCKHRRKQAHGVLLQQPAIGAQYIQSAR